MFFRPSSILNNMSTITPHLAAAIAEAIEAIPIANQSAPLHGDILGDPHDALRRLNDWAFTQGYALVINSATATRARFSCIHHGKATRNSRNTAEEDRVRVATHVRQTNYKFEVYVSIQKRRGGQWIFGYSKHVIHNHPPAIDPFTLPPHIQRRPSLQKSKEIAGYMRGTVGFADAKEVLENQGLPDLSRKQYYNLQRKMEEGMLSPQQEAYWIKQFVEDHDCQVRSKDIWVHSAIHGRQRIIQVLCWWTKEQERMARRFVSQFASATDATFNTNERLLPLQQVVGIDNTGKTFPILQAFVTSESADVFRFIDYILTTFFFYDCPGPSVLVRDFAKGLACAVAQLGVEQICATKAKEQEQSSKGKEREISMEIAPKEPPNNPMSTTTKVDWVANTIESIKTENGVVFLQLCAWHAAEAIKKRLLKSGRYSQEKRLDLSNLIWRWIKSPDLQALEKSRDALLKALRPPEAEYLTTFYRPKERAFIYAFTSKLPNLGMNTTQRAESAHVVAKRGLSKNLPLYKAVEKLTERLLQLDKDYDARINQERVVYPRLLDRDFFYLCLHRITHYALNLSMEELIKAKELLDTLEKRGDLYDSFEPSVGCRLECSLPLRFGIPCRCWMAYFYSRDLPIPLNLFHPRWLYDGPEVLEDPWQISLENINFDQSLQLYNTERYTGRFAGRGRQVIIDEAFKLVEQHDKLPPGEGVPFAAAYKSISNKLSRRQESKLQHLENTPAELPARLEQPKLAFAPGRKRALTGHESAQRQELERSRSRRRLHEYEKLQADAEDRLEAARLLKAAEHSRIAEAYYNLEHLDNKVSLGDCIDSESNSGNTSEFADIDQPGWLEKLQARQQENQSLQGHTSQAPISISSTSSEYSSELSELDEYLSLPPAASVPLPQRSSPAIAPPATAPISRPTRSRKPSRKVASQLSQDKAKEKAKAKAESRKKRIPRGKDTSQLLDKIDISSDLDKLDLPIRSSQ